MRGWRASCRRLARPRPVRAVRASAYWPPRRPLGAQRRQRLHMPPRMELHRAAAGLSAAASACCRACCRPRGPQACRAVQCYGG